MYELDALHKRAATFGATNTGAWPRPTNGTETAVNRRTTLSSSPDNRLEPLLGVIVITLMIAAYAAVFGILRVVVTLGWYVS
jgi:hypothetical protein